jgi:hypothetical protein
MRQRQAQGQAQRQAPLPTQTSKNARAIGQRTWLGQACWLGFGGSEVRYRVHIAVSAAIALALLAIATGSLAPSAFGAPTFDLTLERDAAEFPSVSHSDERVDYTASVQNVATNSAAVGDTLVCDANAAKWFQGPTFSFAWISDGAPASGLTTQPTATTSTYVAQASDEGHSLQCLVTGANGGGAAVSFSNATVVLPIPASPPPALGVSSNRPTITGTATSGSELTCAAPTGWTGSPAWTFQWLRNGSATSGEVTGTTATSSTYKVAAADVPGNIQCKAIGTTGAGVPPDGGAAVAISNNKVTSPAPSPTAPNNNGENRPFTGSPNATSGPVTLEMELPGGEETFSYKAEGAGWTCEHFFASAAEHAKAVCSRSDSLAPQNSYPPLTVIVAIGADAPDVAIARATVSGGGSAGVSIAENEFEFTPPIPFGLTFFQASVVDTEGHDYTQAGGHPVAGLANFLLSRKRRLAPPNGTESAKFLPVENVKQIITDIPRGFAGNALAVPELCPEVADVLSGTCPPGSVVGSIRALYSGSGDFGSGGATLPVYAIEPEFGTPAQFAFNDGLGNVDTFSARLRPEDGYAVSFELAPAPKVRLLESAVILCDFGGDLIGSEFTGCKKAGDPDANPEPLFTNPTRCGGSPPVTKVRLDSWEHPDSFSESQFANAAITGCEEVSFDPQMEIEPTTARADSPSGLDLELTMPTDGLEDPEGIAQANLRDAKVSLPEGMAINASAGQGLGACAADQIKLGTNDPIGCPESSKIGSVEIETPVLEDTLKGSVYIAKQGDVEGSLIGFYLVFDSPRNGILVKLPAKVTPDPQTGQLVVTVAESPEQPFSAVRMHFPGGQRATLLTPPNCGTYQITSELTPWSGGSPVTQTSNFEVNQGPNGGPCPTGALGAKLSAGTEDPTAGRTSPFVMRLSREDGSQRFSALNLTTPPGLTAYLKDIPYCPDSVLAGISADAGTGQAQIDHPSCPAASQVGTVTAGAGAGSDPLFVDTGKAYLAGPYKGAPLSLAVVAPAVAGPLDLGTVVVRNALSLNPETAQVTVKSDPIPTILHGILLDIRDIRIAVNRSHFTLNPTNCDPMSVGAEVTGESGASASLSNRFQVSGCDRLSFKPKLDIRLSGGTRRGSHPRLRGVLEAGPGEANIGRAAVTIPRSEFLDQAHIRTICTRVQFAADACPKGSVYGHATATTPLLGYPVTGPVYLRSSNHKLPDLVVDLHGPDWQPIEATVVGRIDSIKGQIRTTFENAPDVPLTKFVLSMQGGRKGLLINSRDICATTNRATVRLTGHNAAEFGTRPAVKDGKCKTERKARRKRR